MILNTIIIDDSTYTQTIRYCSATILLMNTVFISVLNLLKYHISLSTEIKECIMIDEEIETTIRLYKTYLLYSMDNKYIVPERTIKTAEKTLNKKYTNSSKDLNQIDDTSFMYISELISEIRQLLATKQTSVLRYSVSIEEQQTRDEIQLQRHRSECSHTSETKINACSIKGKLKSKQMIYRNLMYK